MPNRPFICEFCNEQHAPFGKNCKNRLMDTAVSFTGATMPNETNATELLASLRLKIKKDYGKKCKEWAPLCSTCETYQALETLEWMMQDDD